MAPNKKGKSRRKGLFIAEMVILAVLTVALIGAIWVTHKLSLVNYDTNFDRSQVKTSTEYNNQSTTTTSTTETADAQVAVTETPEDTSTQTAAQVGSQTQLSGIQTIALVGLDTRETEDDYEGLANSDTMIICVINHNERTIKLASVYRDTYLNVYWDGEDYYDKANSAYALGGAEEFLTMLNLNLDLDITQYATVEFKALQVTIDLLGGLDVELTQQEIVHLNNYNIETAAACGVEYVEIPVPSDDELYGAQTATYHLNGSQAVSYARIRYTDGYDFRRASRQRVILQLIKEKAASADVFTINNLLNQVLPLVTTNLDSSEIMSMAIPVLSYTLTSDDQTGFPSVHVEDSGGEITGSDCVIPVTLAYNVQVLHEFLYPGYEYYPSDTVLATSEYIASTTGYGDDQIAAAASVYDNSDIPAYTDLKDLYTSLGYGDDTSSSDESGYYDEDGNYISY